MKKTLIITFSILILLLFVVILNSGYFLKNSFSNDDDILKQLSLIEAAINNNEWDRADMEIEKSLQAWEKVRKRVQFSVEREHLEKLNCELCTLKGTIIVENKNDAIITLEKIKGLWSELAK